MKSKFRCSDGIRFHLIVPILYYLQLCKYGPMCFLGGYIEAETGNKFRASLFLKELPSDKT